MAKEQKRSNKEIKKPKQVKAPTGQTPAKGSLFPTAVEPKKKK